MTNGKTNQPTAHKPLLGKAAYALSKSVCVFLWRNNSGSITGSLPEKPFILVANHGSYLDWLLLDVFLRREFQRDIVFVAKQKVMENAWWRLLAQHRQAIVTDEASGPRTVASIIKFFRIQVAPPIIGIFPEGKRSLDGKAAPAFRGAAWLARKLNVPMIPVALCGFWETWPPHQRLPSLKLGKLAIRFLPPVHAHQFESDQHAIDFAMSEIYRVVTENKSA